MSLTGIDQDTAGAILINREPGKVDEARAGIFVGSTYDDGNVPRDEQEAIIEDALIPPLRDGDVAGSLSAGIDRLASDIRTGPPMTALDRFADGPGSTWLPWAGSVLALLGLLLVGTVFRGRAKPSVSRQPPTTVRPDHSTDAAFATALVHRSAQPSSVPGTILALADADALAFEQDKKPGKVDKGTVKIRLVDRTRARGEVQQAVWSMLAERAEDDVVPGDELKKIARGPGATKELVEEHSGPTDSLPTAQVDAGQRWPVWAYSAALSRSGELPWRRRVHRPCGSRWCCRAFSSLQDCGRRSPTHASRTRAWTPLAPGRRTATD